MIDWTTDPAMRRRAQVGLNKGEAQHALKRVINFHQRGELRDRTEEGQHYRVAGLQRPSDATFFRRRARDRGLRGLASRFGRSPTPGARRPDRRCGRGSLGC